jgi:hypothetical protein
VTILIRLILYIIYIAPIVSPPQHPQALFCIGHFLFFLWWYLGLNSGPIPSSTSPALFFVMGFVFFKTTLWDWSYVNAATFRKYFLPQPLSIIPGQRDPLGLILLDSCGSSLCTCPYTCTPVTKSRRLWPTHLLKGELCSVSSTWPSGSFFWNKVK